VVSLAMLEYYYASVVNGIAQTAENYPSLSSSKKQKHTVRGILKSIFLCM